MPSITLPFPDKILNPNAVAHWAPVARAKKAAKGQAYWTVHEALSAAERASVAAREGNIPVKLRFVPPDRRKRDQDNMVASMKAALDGIAQALGVDDVHFRLSYEFAAPEKPGRVEVTL